MKESLSGGVILNQKVLLPISCICIFIQLFTLGWCFAVSILGKLVAHIHGCILDSRYS